jgi:tetratricopeptide (TPR) repeat protein
LALARAAHDRTVLLRVMNLVYVSLWIPDTCDERHLLSSEAVELARELHDVVGEFWATHWWISGSFENATPVGSAIENQARTAARLGQPFMQYISTHEQFCEAQRQGDLNSAEAVAEHGLRIGSESGEPEAPGVYAGHLWKVRWQQRRAREVLPLLEPSVELFAQSVQRTRNPITPLVAIARIEAGAQSSAQTLLTEALPGFAGPPTEFIWLAANVTLAYLATMLDDHNAAATLIERLRPYDQTYVCFSADVNGSVAHALGCLATVLQNYDEADQYFDIADTLNARLEAPFYVALTKFYRATMQLQRSHPGDRDRAQEHLAEALDIARQHGFVGIEQDALQLGDRYNL